jgi:hypothetical protein
MRWALAALACVALAAAVSAKMVPPPALPLRVAVTDAVVIGKVIGLNEKLVPGEMFKGDLRQMQIATVKVGESLLGKGDKEIKVGFFPPPATGPGAIRPPRFGVRLAKDQEAALLLVKHPTKKDLYVIKGMFDLIVKTGNANFAEQAKEIKKAAKLLSDPSKGLQSKDAAERYLTAAMLITRYRTAPTGTEKTELVPAMESKTLLTVLADGDWSGRNPLGYGMAAPNLFYRLGLTDMDGWKPRVGTPFDAQVKTWLKANANKYRIKRFVGTKLETLPDPEP